MRYAVELLYLFGIEAGADLDRAAARIGDPEGRPTAAELAPEVQQLVDAGRLTPEGGGWRTVPLPDPVDVARQALADVVAEPDPDRMTEIAAAALEKLDAGTV